MPIRSARQAWRSVPSNGRHPFLLLDVEWPEATGEQAIAQTEALVRALARDADEGPAEPTALSVHPSLQGGGSPALLLTRLARHIERMARPALGQIHDELAGAATGPDVAYPCTDETATRRILQASFRLLAEALRRAGANQLRRDWFDVEIRSLIAYAAGELPNDVTLACIHRARAKGVPCRRTSSFMRLYRFGDGSRQKLLWRGFSERTSHVGVTVATNKTVACELLWRHGLPAPEQRAVTTLDAALRAGSDLGFPVVVKPQSTDYGTAVEAGITSHERLRIAYEAARPHGTVLVEQHIAGFDHRILVLGGRATRAHRRIPAHVVGDGARTVGELIDLTAAERRKNPDLRSFGFVAKDDPQALDLLARQGLSLNAVPASGRTVNLRTNANLSTGGTSESVADIIHPDNLRLAERAAAVFGLDIAGIDLISPDISVSWLDNAAAICEVNPTPVMPYAEDPDRLLEHLTGGSRLRTPVAIALADDGELDAIAAALGRHTSPAALTVAKGGSLTRGGHRLARPLPSPRIAVEFALSDPQTDALLIGLRPHEAAALDLGIDFADIAYIAEAAGGAAAEAAMPELVALGCEIVAGDRAAFLERFGRLARGVSSA